MLYGNNQHVRSVPLSARIARLKADRVTLSNTEETSSRSGWVYPLTLRRYQRSKPAVQSLTARHVRRCWGHFVGGAVLLLLLTLSRFCLLTGAPPTPFLPRRSCANFSVIHFSSVLNNAINVTLMSSTQFTAPLPVCLLLWLVTGDTSRVRRAAGELDGRLFFKSYMWSFF